MVTEMQHRAFLGVLALASIGFFWVILPFFGAVFWAVILAIVFRPLQAWLERALGGRRNLAAGLSLFVCIVSAILPMIVVIGALISEGTQLVQRIQSGGFAPPPSAGELFDKLPNWAQAALDRIGIGDFDALRGRLVSALTQVSQFLAAQALNVGQNTLRFFASFGIMLYVLFFLFRDGPAIGRTIRASLPFSPEVSRALLSKFAAVIRATVKGNVIIAALQGAIGGVTFWLLGVQGAFLWGVMMAFLSLLPAVGAAIVWAPVAAYLLLSGDYVRGGVLVAVGVAVIGLVDNVLRPPLVGKETRLPDYVVLVSTLGGLSLFGINGFVIGPLIAALFFACWTIFRDDRAERAARDLAVAAPATAATPPR